MPTLGRAEDPVAAYAAALEAAKKAGLGMGAAYAAAAAAQRDAAMKDLEERKVREREQAKAEEARFHKAYCDEHRDERVAEIRAEIDFTRRVVPKAKAILAACRVTMIKTGAKVLDRTVNGQLRISAEEFPGVVCSSLPKGISKQDAEQLVARMQPDSGYHPVTRIDTGMDACRADDLAVGLDTNVSMSDADGIKRLLDWTPPAAAPAASP